MSLCPRRTHLPGIPHILYRLMYQLHSLSLYKNLPQNQVQQYMYLLKRLLVRFSLPAKGTNHRQGHPGSKYMKPPETAITAAVAAPLQFYNILKEHKCEPQQQLRAI